MRIYEIVDFIESRKELKKLITDSAYTKARYRPRSPGKSEDGLALKHFWDSEDGLKFVYEFERASRMNLASSQARRQLKLAVFDVIIRHRMEEGISE